MGIIGFGAGMSLAASDISDSDGSGVAALRVCQAHRNVAQSVLRLLRLDERPDWWSGSRCRRHRKNRPNRRNDAEFRTYTAGGLGYGYPPNLVFAPACGQGRRA